MGGSTIDQGKVDLYYEKKKDEVSAWLIEYINSLKRAKDQKDILMDYAKKINFNSAGSFNNYVQAMPTISKKDKKRLEKYLLSIDWLPDDTTAGFLDGQLVVRMMPNTQAEEMIRAAFGPEEGEDNSDN